MNANAERNVFLWARCSQGRDPWAVMVLVGHRVLRIPLKLCRVVSRSSPVHGVLGG